MDANQIYRAALGDYEAGHLEAAEARIRELLGQQPRHFDALIFRGHLAELRNRPQEALAAYAAAEESLPGHAFPFTRRSIIAFRSAFGAPPQPRPTGPGLPVVSLSTLGHNGRFGNQLLQYAFVRLYAQEHGLVAQVPDWIGRDLFDLDDPFPERRLPVVEEAHTDVFASLNRQSDRVFANCDLYGYFAGHSGRWRRPDGFRALFSPAAKLRQPLGRALEQVSARGRTLVAMHLRRGDFGARGYWIAPTSWYREWLKGLWGQLDAPVLYIATDDPSVIGDFSDFSPLHDAGLGVDLPGAGFYLDHFLLSRAHHLGISNSTFSFTAAMLNVRSRSFWRPDPQLRQMTPFDPWNAELSLACRPDDRCPCDSGKRFEHCCGAG